MTEHIDEVPQDEYWEAQTKWTKELQASHRELQDFHQRGDKILELYTDDRKLRRTKRFPLFNANVDILQNALFARIPRPDVNRRFKDPDDHVGRVAALILQRALVTELESSSAFKDVSKSVIKDMLVVGLGAGWVRYESETAEDPQITDDEDDELADRADASPVLKDQQTPIDYVHWKDLRWRACRTWNENSWVGRRVFMCEDDAKERFGERANYLSYTSEKFRDINTDGRNEPQFNIEPQAEVWEIWDKDTKKVYWICESAPTALDIKDDFLGLPDFFPTDRPLVSNVSTSKFIPQADYTQFQDQYNDLHEVNNRISRLVKACRLAGVYDDSQPAVKLVLEGAAEHQLIPIKNWGSFTDKGGVRGAIEFIPLQEVAAVIAELEKQREALKQQIYELTGISDIVRGASSPYETAAAQGMKAQYASIRLQGKQADVADYLSGMIRRKAYLMIKFYTPERLLQRCGTLTQFDQQFVAPAMKLLQDELMSTLKLEISTDALQEPNWARDQQERTQTVQAVGQLMGQALPAVQQFPALAPFLGHLVKWAVSGTRGSNEIEGLLDMSLQQMMQGQQQSQDKPDPAEQAAQQQAAMAQQRAQAEMQLKAQGMQADAQIAQQKLALEQQKAQAELELKREQTKAELELKREIELLKAQQKNVPQYVHGNVGMEADDLVPILQQMQQTMVQAVTASAQNTIEAITALATAPQEPAQVVVRRDETGALVGVIQ